MSNLTDFIGGAPKISLDVNVNGIKFPYQENTKISPIITTSSTYIVPTTGKYFVFISGGGGSGGNCSNSGDADYIMSSGGGSGAINYGIFNLAANDNIAVTIGAGGAGTSSLSDGSSGGSTSFGNYLSTPIIQNAGKYQTSSSDALYPSDGFRIAHKNNKDDFEIGALYLDDIGIVLRANKNITNGTHSKGTYTNSLGGGSSLICSTGGCDSLVTSYDSMLGAGSDGAGRTNNNTSSGNGGDGFALIIKLGD